MQNLSLRLEIEVSHFSTEKTLHSNYTWIEPTQGRWRWRSHVRTE